MRKVPSDRWPPSRRREERRRLSRANLLYMLQIAGGLKFRDRTTAGFRGSRLPILDTVTRTFAERLQRELLRGLDSAYVRLEGNLPRFRGRLLIPKQVRYNAAHLERFFCRVDEFLPDTPVNRVFKAACRRLLDVTTRPATQEPLRHCLLLLDDVTDVAIGREVFDTVGFNRQNERFKDLFEFCRWVIVGQSPSLQAGRHRSFSLLFNMNTVFERFIAEVLRRTVTPEDGWAVIPQSRGKPRWLMKDADDTNRRSGVRLQPDILIELGGETLVMDTKWKDLGQKNRPSNADLYQLYAYAQQFEAKHSVLLYPRTSESQCRDFEILNPNGESSESRVCVRFVGLDLDSREGRAKLGSELRTIIERASCENAQTDGSASIRAAQRG